MLVPFMLLVACQAVSADSNMVPIAPTCFTPKGASNPACAKVIQAALAAKKYVNSHRPSSHKLELLKIDHGAQDISTAGTTKFDIRILLGDTKKGYAVKSSVRAYRSLLSFTPAASTEYKVTYSERVQAPETPAVSNCQGDGQPVTCRDPPSCNARFARIVRDGCSVCVDPQTCVKTDVPGIHSFASAGHGPPVPTADERAAQGGALQAGTASGSEDGTGAGAAGGAGGVGGASGGSGGGGGGALKAAIADSRAFLTAALTAVRAQLPADLRAKVEDDMVLSSLLLTSVMLLAVSCCCLCKKGKKGPQKYKAIRLEQVRAVVGAWARGCVGAWVCLAA
jgi:hypothetical protein